MSEPNYKELARQFLLETDGTHEAAYVQTKALLSIACSLIAQEQTCTVTKRDMFKRETESKQYFYWLSCGHLVETVNSEPPNYCPDCGAKIAATLGGGECEDGGGIDANSDAP